MDMSQNPPNRNKTKKINKIKKMFPSYWEIIMMNPMKVVQTLLMIKNKNKNYKNLKTKHPIKILKNI